MESVEINKNNYKVINPDTIILVFFAESGAMGNPGEVKILCKNGKNYKLYVTNYTYGGVTEKVKTLSDIVKEEEKIFKLIPILKELDLNHSFIRGSGWADDKWWLIDLRFGNHLLIKDRDILIELSEKFENKPPEDIYGGWQNVVEDYIKNKG